MKLPERYNYAEAYLTFRCNLNCNYCINRIGGLKNRKELSALEWATALNRIDFNKIPLTLGGGEPTKHNEFFDLMDRLNMPIDLLTNLQFDIDEFIKRIDPNKFSKGEKEYYHPIRVSYHAGYMDRDKTIRDVKRLREAGFNAAIFGIRHPYTINENMSMAFFCAHRWNGVPFYEKDFLGEVDGRMYGFYKYPEGLDGIKKDVMCRTRELLIAPNGNIHRCHRDLYLNENWIGNIKDLQIDDNFRHCSNYGECNPCDLKLKTNRYLKGVECQIEIKCSR